MEELLGVIVREDDPQVGFQCLKILADLSRYLFHLFHDAFVFRVGHREELRGMGQHGAADDRGNHGEAPCVFLFRTLPGRVIASQLDVLALFCQ